MRRRVRENLSSQPHTHLWAPRRFTGFCSSHMASPGASFLLFLPLLPPGFPSFLLSSPLFSLAEQGHCRPVRSAPTSAWKPRPRPHPSAFHTRAESVWSSAGGRDGKTLKASDTRQGETVRHKSRTPDRKHRGQYNPPPPRCSYISTNSHVRTSPHAFIRANVWKCVHVF